MQYSNAITSIMAGLLCSAGAMAETAKSDFELGYEVGFKDGLAAGDGGGGVQGLQPGHTIFVPSQTGGNTTLDQVSNPFLTVYDGQDWSFITLSPESPLAQYEAEIDLGTATVEIEDDMGLFKSLGGDPVAAAERLQSSTGFDAAAWAKAAAQSDLSGVGPGVMPMDTLNLPFPAD